ncbi:MAG: LysR family transcriptional regulator substrate-binding protein, partial [Planctomycetales bacterium]|nr:LysR family transcriptional regulator substrate-binding protein [Planctomycetales bacterium]
AIAALPLKAKYLEVEEIAREELLLVLPPDHPLVAKRRVSLKDVAEHPFVLLDEAHCLADGITTFCRQNAFHPVTVERTSQLAMVQELVALAHGVSFIPSMAQRLDASPRRVYRRLSGSRPTRSLAMASNPYRFQSKLLAAFRAELRAYASAFPSA